MKEQRVKLAETLLLLLMIGFNPSVQEVNSLLPKQPNTNGTGNEPTKDAKNKAKAGDGRTRLRPDDFSIPIYFSYGDPSSAAAGVGRADRPVAAGDQ
jgi:hypothetical protein